jgi:hypothetical protein
LSLSQQPSALSTATVVEDDHATPDTPELKPGGDGGGRSRWRPRLRRAEPGSARWWTTTVLAAALVTVALVLPNRLERLTPGNFVALPLEGLVGVALVLLLPPRARRWFAALFGVALGLLTIQKAFDLGFYSVLARPFDPVLDATLLGPGVDYLMSSVGRGAAIGVVVGVVALAVAIVVRTTLATLRVARAVTRYRRRGVQAVAVVAVAWALCAVLGAEYVPGRPVASYGAATIAYDRGAQVVADVRDRQQFADEAAVDAFRDTPGDRMLTGLRGKDVVLTFVESYGRDAIEDPAMAAGVGATLDDGSRRLRAAGYTARSGWLNSSTVGGSSWLAHSTLLSGLWISTAQRYRTLVNSDRLTLNGAFERAGWRSVAVMPQIRRAWPEGDFYGYDRLYGLHELGYRGPRFGYASMPDQFTLAALQRLERSKPGHRPVLAEVALVSSHAPWAPLPTAVGWDEVGDGSVYDPMVKPGGPRRVVWPDADQARTAYATSIRYSVNSLVSYVERYGDDNLVLVFLGDHQPAPLVTGPDARHDVPITIVAHDPRVLDRVADWGWTDGLKPATSAPVWPMDSFRDRFLTAFGSTPSSP